MSNSSINYISIIIIIIAVYFAIYFGYNYVSKIKIINNELKILQTFDPAPEMIKELLDNHQPIVIQKEIMFWKQFKLLLGKELDHIKNEIATNKEINYSEIIKKNLEVYNLPLTYDWNIDIRNINLDYQSAIFFVKQDNYMQLFGCVSGEMRIIIAPPDQSKYIEPIMNLVSTVDATPILNKEPIEMNYIEIIVRQGNMIYVPWGWLYFIYNGNNQKECVIIDCLNKSALTLI
jgi:hypothetical protein